MKKLVAATAISVLFAGACSSSSAPKAKATTTVGGGATTTVNRSTLAKLCDTKSFAAAAKPVNITYWHSLTQANGDALKKLTDSFNSSQSDVHVALQNQGGTDETLTKFKGVAGSAGAPDVLQIGETSLQTMIDSKAIVPAQACVDATGANLDDLLARVRDYYTVAGATWALPFNVSQPVLLYNKAVFRKAGLNPDSPPTDFESLVSTAKQLQAKGGVKYGFQYKRDNWVLEQFLALAGEPYVDAGNGRGGRAKSAIFNTPTAIRVLTALQSLVNSGVATTNGTEAGESLSNLLGICNGDNAMTIDTSGALGTAYDTLAKGQCKTKVEVGVAPLPLPAGPQKGGTLVGGAANYIARPGIKNERSPKVLAAFKFAQYLTTAKSQAAFAAATGYIPISKAAASQAAITSVWAAKPGYRIAFDQLANGVQNVASSGPLIGAYKDVRTAIKAALEAIFIDKKDVATAIAKAVEDANVAIKSYNANNS